MPIAPKQEALCTLGVNLETLTKPYFWKMGRSVREKLSFLMVGEIQVGKIKKQIRISVGWGNPGTQIKDFWRLGRLSLIHI